MKEVKPNPSKPSQARLSDRPVERPWGIIVGIVIMLVISSPFWLIPGWIIIGGLTSMAYDRLNGPLRLENAVSATAPDGKTKFEVTVNGEARLVATATGRTLHTRRIPVEDYRRISVAWENNTKVEVVCAIRYPAMAFQKNYFWDSTSGSVTSSWDRDVRDFK